MANMGAGNMDYRQLAQKIESHTGGIEFSPICTIHHSGIRRPIENHRVRLTMHTIYFFLGLSKFQTGIAMSSFCLDRNLDYMFELLHTVLSDPKFDDVERLKSLIFGNTSEMQESLVESGHTYARILASSVFSKAHV